MNSRAPVLLVVILSAAMVACGCTSSNQGFPPATPPTTLPNQIETTVSTPSPSPIQNISTTRTQLDKAWRDIQVAYDTYKEKRDRLGATDTGVQTNDDISYLRQTLIPDAISAYQSIEMDLSSMNISNPDLDSEKKVLLSICDYKIKYFEGLDAGYQGIVLEATNVKKSRDAYKNAKYSFQDAIDVINVMGIGISSVPSEKQPPYSQKYWDYIYQDKVRIEDLLAWADENVSRLAS